MKAPPGAAPELVCNTCTRRLVAIAYRRAPWFRLLREPLRWGMRLWVRRLGLDTGIYVVRSASCADCNRFYKNVLKENSAAFCRLHARLNPVFDALIVRILGEAEVARARDHAQAAVMGEALPFGGEEEAARDGWSKI